MASGQYLSYPAASSGLSTTTGIGAWAFPISWSELVSSAAVAMNAIGVQFQITTVSTTGGQDTTFEMILEIGTGTAGNEVLQIQVPYTWRYQTKVGYYLHASITIYFPRGLFIAGGQRVAVRAASSAGSDTFNGIKLLYVEV